MVFIKKEVFIRDLQMEHEGTAKRNKQLMDVLLELLRDDLSSGLEIPYLKERLLQSNQ